MLNRFLTAVFLLYSLAAYSVPFSKLPSDLDFNHAMSLANQERWEEAREAFHDGWTRAPRDKRFPTELAGIAYLQKDFSKAKHYLHFVLRLDPVDAYANEFLATLYFLEGNLEAALQYWNLVGRPYIEQIRVEPQPRINPVLLDRAFTAAPASVLMLEDFLATQERIRLLGVFPKYKFELSPTQKGRFDLILHPLEKNGWVAKNWIGWISVFRGLPYKTVYPEVFNLNRKAINIRSLWRWDPHKERVSASLSAPFAGAASHRYEFFFDGRTEDWNIEEALSVPLSSSKFHAQTWKIGTEIESAVNGRWGWSSGMDVSHRTFSDAPQELKSGSLFTSGLLFGYNIGAHSRLLYSPERRLTMDSRVTAHFGSLLTTPSSHFLKIEGVLENRWLPWDKGEDYQVTERLRIGKSFGDVPFDQLSILGVERDTDLWMRAHNGFVENKKGSNPMGGDYLLLSLEISKMLHENGFFQVAVTPYFDSGKIVDKQHGVFGSDWLWDLGVQARLTILKQVTLMVSYGKDLRTGNNAFYITTGTFH